MNKVILFCAVLVVCSACTQVFDIKKNFKPEDVDVIVENSADEVAAVGPENKTEDTRILLTPENVMEYGREHDFREKFNFDSPTTTVTYENLDKGIRVGLPYNPNWGSDTYRIKPYDECIDECTIYRNSVLFGPIGESEGGWTRHKYSLRILESKTADELISEPLGYGVLLAPRKTIINGLEVVKFADRGQMNTFYIIVIGQNYNYQFAITGETEKMEELFAELEKVVATVELLD